MKSKRRRHKHLVTGQRISAQVASAPGPREVDNVHGARIEERRIVPKHKFRLLSIDKPKINQTEREHNPHHRQELFHYPILKPKRFIWRHKEKIQQKYETPRKGRLTCRMWRQGKRKLNEKNKNRKNEHLGTGRRTSAQVASAPFPEGTTTSTLPALKNVRSFQGTSAAPIDDFNGFETKQHQRAGTQPSPPVGEPRPCGIHLWPSSC